MRGITKRFPGVQALDDVDATLRAGEIHGVAGENGSGKSTLLKVLAGRYAPDAGEIAIDGQVSVFHSPTRALHAGVALIAQEVLVQSELTVAENLLFGRMPRRRGGFIDWPGAVRAAADILGKWSLRVDPRARLAALPLHTQHMVAIAKMVERRPRVLLLDEPTSSLGEGEVTTLFAMLRRLRDEGIAVVYVTHRLREYFELSDRLTVLRDGRLVSSQPIGDLDEPALVRMMVGRSLSSIFARTARRERPAPTPDPALRVRGLRTRKLRDVDLAVGQGEIVGVAGQAGAGRSSLARALFGLDRHLGTIEIGGRSMSIRSPRDAIKAGLGYVPEDRKGAGLVLDLAVSENVTMPVWGRVSRFGIRNAREERKIVDEAIARLRIRCPGPDVSVATLSGGNQQKVVLAKWMAHQTRLLLLDEPTRGVDVGAKAEIYGLIEELAGRGMGVLVFSSELLELLRLSDRILVMAHGAIVGEQAGAEATEESITAMSFRHPGLREAA